MITQIIKEHADPVVQQKSAIFAGVYRAHYGDKPLGETTWTVKHMLPLNPEQHWQDCFGSNWKQFNQRLGNMALSTSKENQNMTQKAFNEKQEMLLQTPCHVNKNIALYNEWTVVAIESRQNGLAEQAVQWWKMD